MIVFARGNFTFELPDRIIFQMNIAILCGSDGWHIRDLQRAATELGYAVTLVDFRSVSANVPHEPFCPELAGADAVIVRTMPPGSLEQVVFRMDLLQGLQARGIPVLNSPRALEICVDKYLCLERLRQHGLRVPETVVCQTGDAAMAAFERLGQDVVVKPLFGSEGRGLMRISDLELAWRTFRTLERTDCVLYLQRFIPHPGYDVRAFVLNGQILGAMKRTAHNDWRTNVAQGATAEPLTLTAEQSAIALAASRIVGTHAAGVDLLPGPDGQWYVIEVNAVPGWRSLSAVTQIDVARRLLETITVDQPAITPGQLVQTACLWEVLAPKAGNVHPGARFRDMSHLDFVHSATAIGPILGSAVDQPLGETILRAIQVTRLVTKTNTNLGIVLLLAPLASVPPTEDLRGGVARILQKTTVQDSVNVYEAIRLAIPGGLGEAPDQDVRKQPTKKFLDVMALAANYDQIAAEYASNYREIFEFGVPTLIQAFRQYGRLEPTILHLQLEWLARFEDTLINRKRGPVISRDVQQRAKAILETGGPFSPQYREFDRWLREDGNARNPGTTADLVTACLYVALRQRTLTVDTSW